MDKTAFVYIHRDDQELKDRLLDYCRELGLYYVVNYAYNMDDPMRIDITGIPALVNFCGYLYSQHIDSYNFIEKCLEK